MVVLRVKYVRLGFFLFVEVFHGGFPSLGSGFGRPQRPLLGEIGVWSGNNIGRHDMYGDLAYQKIFLSVHPILSLVYINKTNMCSLFKK